MKKELEFIVFPALSVLLILSLFVWGNVCLQEREQKSQLDQASLEQVQTLNETVAGYETQFDEYGDRWSELLDRATMLELRADKLEYAVSLLMGCNIVCDDPEETAVDRMVIGNCARTYPYEAWDSIEVKPGVYKVFWQSVLSVGWKKQYNETYESKPAKIGTQQCFTLDAVIGTAQE